jgi:hypothetical protein
MGRDIADACDTGRYRNTRPVEQGTGRVASPAKLTGNTYGASPPDAETEGKWANESWSALVRQHGQKEANALLADAQKLVARDPRVKALLEITRLGSPSKIVAKLVALARSEKGRGRLE